MKQVAFPQQSSHMEGKQDVPQGTLNPVQGLCSMCSTCQITASQDA